MQTSLTREKGTYQNRGGQQDCPPWENGAFFQSNDRGERLSMRLPARAGQARSPAQVLAAVRTMRANPSPPPPPRSGEGEQDNPSPPPPPQSGEGERSAAYTPSPL